MTLEMGAESGLARYFVLALSIKMLRDIAYRISSVCGSIPTCQEDGTSVMVCKEPYGVVLGIAPWYEAWKFPCRIRFEQLINQERPVCLRYPRCGNRHCYWKHHCTQGLGIVTSLLLGDWKGFLRRGTA